MVTYAVLQEWLGGTGVIELALSAVSAGTLGYVIGRKVGVSPDLRNARLQDLKAALPILHGYSVFCDAARQELVRQLQHDDQYGRSSRFVFRPPPRRVHPGTVGVNGEWDLFAYHQVLTHELPLYFVLFDENCTECLRRLLLHSRAALERVTAIERYVHLKGQASPRCVLEVVRRGEARMVELTQEELDSRVEWSMSELERLLRVMSDECIEMITVLQRQSGLHHHSRLFVRSV